MKGDVLCKTPGGAPICEGSRWREAGYGRVVEVRAYLPMPNDKVGIQTVQDDGTLAARMTWAARRRFNGTGGYFEISQSPPTGRVSP